ncbi:hypothetical protein PFISCL1PPCAC_1136, partial [Pristionchus fissidentatus]
LIGHQEHWNKLCRRDKLFTEQEKMDLVIFPPLAEKLFESEWRVIKTMIQRKEEEMNDREYIQRQFVEGIDEETLNRIDQLLLRAEMVIQR